MNAAFLVAFVVLPVVAYIRVRNTTWLVIHLATSVSVAGVLVGLARDRGYAWTLPGLQLVLLIALAIVTALAFLRPVPGTTPLRRQFLALLLPAALVAAFVVLVTTLWTERPAFFTPVSYLIGHSVAEDNAKWLDFASQLASGDPIVQAVPMGGPLQLLVVFVATLMAVISTLLLGGVNEVAVAANAVIFAEFFMVMLVPLMLAPIADMRLRRSAAGPKSDRIWIPWPFMWLGALIIGAASLLVTAYGHLTLQFTFLIAALWSATFLARTRIRRARFMTSLVVAAGMTVWLPLNVLAVVILGGLLALLLAVPIRRGWRALDFVGLGLWLVVAVSVWEPIRSSLVYLLGAPSASGPAGDIGGMGVAAGRGTSALVFAISPGPAALAHVLGLDEGSLFGSSGGTEVTGPILAVLALASAVVAVVVLSQANPLRDRATYVRFVPVGLLCVFSIGITTVDAWVTGSAPHYGSVKFTFMTVVVVLGTTAPLALVALDRNRSGMTPARWAATGAVVLLLVIDTILPRSLAAIRPEQWSPPTPFDNPASYWWPADVNDSANQPISTNPVACVYLPQGAKVPSALMASQLSDAQRVYSCTRIIAGLAGSDTAAQPLVDWLRREWLTNTPAWAEVYDGLAAMPASVLSKPVILLDEGSNVIGLESVQALLDRYPKYAGKTPEEMAIINQAATS